MLRLVVQLNVDTLNTQTIYLYHHQNFSSLHFDIWWLAHRMVQYQDCHSRGQEVSNLQILSAMVRGSYVLNCGQVVAPMVVKKEKHLQISEWM